MVWKWREVKGVFIGPESNGRPIQGAYVRHYCTVVQMLPCTSRYYPEGIPKSSGRPVLRAYVRYYYTAIQMLFCTTRYYLVDFVNSVAYVRCTVHRVRLYYLSERTSDGGPPYVCTANNSVHPVFQRTFALKYKGVCLPTLAYVRSRSPISQNALLANPSDPKSKLTF